MSPGGRAGSNGVLRGANLLKAAGGAAAAKSLARRWLQICPVRGEYMGNGALVVWLPFFATQGAHFSQPWVAFLVATGAGKWIHFRGQIPDPKMGPFSGPLM